MPEPEVSVRELIETKLTAMDQRLAQYAMEHRRHHDELAQQLQRDARTVAEKLVEMNNLRQQITAERALYVTRDVLDARVNGLTQRIEDAVKAAGEATEALRQRIADIEKARANLEGRITVLGSIFLGASVLINLIINVAGFVWAHH